MEDKLSGNDLLAGVGGEGIDPRQIGHQRILMAPDGPALLIHRNPGEIPYMLVGPGQLIKECGFPAILVPCQSKGQLGSLGKRVLICLHMVFTALA